MAAVWLLALRFGGAASAWDRAVLSALHNAQRSWATDLAWTITWLGDWLVLVPLALAGALLLLWRKTWQDALALLVAVAAVRIVVAGQKVLFGRARPDVEPLMVEYSHSFPSAHAANSAITFLALAILLTRAGWALPAACAVTAVVGLSRMVLGVHWPSDVVGGWAFAVLAALVLHAWRTRRVSAP
jgi:undecaprenyl-diphosphatase